MAKLPMRRGMSPKALEKWLRNTIETQPCTAVMIALGFGLAFWPNAPPPF